MFRLWLLRGPAPGAPPPMAPPGTRLPRPCNAPGKPSVQPGVGWTVCLPAGVPHMVCLAGPFSRVSLFCYVSSWCPSSVEPSRSISFHNDTPSILTEAEVLPAPAWHCYGLHSQVETDTKKLRTE